MAAERLVTRIPDIGLPEGAAAAFSGKIRIDFEMLHVLLYILEYAE